MRRLLRVTRIAMLLRFCVPRLFYSGSPDLRERTVSGNSARIVSPPPCSFGECIIRLALFPSQLRSICPSSHICLSHGQSSPSNLPSSSPLPGGQRFTRCVLTPPPSQDGALVFFQCMLANVKPMYTHQPGVHVKYVYPDGKMVHFSHKFETKELQLSYASRVMIVCFCVTVLLCATRIAM